MHIHFLDPYRPHDSLIHKLDPRIKLVLALTFILTNTLVPNGAWPVYILLFTIILSVEILSEVGVSYVLKRSTLAFPFVLAALPLVLTIPGEVIFSLPVGRWAISMTYPGLERFISIAFTSWISVQAAIVLAASTPFPELLVAMRAIGVPRLLVSIFGLMWRYLFVLVDEANRLMRARAARSGYSKKTRGKSGGGIAWRARVTGGMAGNLFLRAIERSERIYMAMLSRGYDGEARSLPLARIQAAHWVTLFLSVTLLVILLSFAYLFWG
jgi:cobalt/nickel transport system permease protein